MLIASSRPAFRAALAQYLSQHCGLVCAVPVEELFAGEPHDVIVLDAVNLAGAFAKLPQITTASPASRIILLVARPSDLVAAKARGAGVQGILSEEDDLDAWRVMVGRIRATDFLTGPSFRGAPAFRSLLTGRQASVYELVVQGRSDEEAARELGISVATLETHRRDVQIKLGCGGHRELVAHALRHGLLDPIDVRLQSPLRQATRRHCPNVSLP